MSFRGVPRKGPASAFPGRGTGNAVWRRGRRCLTPGKHGLEMLFSATLVRNADSFLLGSLCRACMREGSHKVQSVNPVSLCSGHCCLSSRRSYRLARLEPAQDPQVILRDADWVVRAGWCRPVGLGMEGDLVGQELPVRCAGSGASVTRGCGMSRGACARRDWGKDGVFFASPCASTWDAR